MTDARTTQHYAEVLRSEQATDRNARTTQHYAEVLRSERATEHYTRTTQHYAEVLRSERATEHYTRTTQHAIEVLRSVAGRDRATVEAYEEVSVSSGTSVTVPVPSAAGTDDFLLTYVTWSGSSTITAPDGWILIDSSSQGALYYRIVDAEPADYTWTFDNATDIYAITMSVENVDLNDPIADFTVQDDNVSPLELISLTATRDNTLKVTGGQGSNNGNGIGRPNNNDPLTRGSANSISYVVSQQTVDEGSTGTTTFTNDVGVVSRNGFAILLNSSGEAALPSFLGTPHVVFTSVFQLDPAGNLIDKASATTLEILVSRQELCVVPNLSIPNSLGYPTIQQYILAEAASNYVVESVSNNMIITKPVS